MQLPFLLGYEMAAIQSQILQDGFDGLSNSLSVGQVNSRGQQINGLSASSNTSVISQQTIQSPGTFIHEKSPTSRVISLNSANMQHSQHNDTSRSG